jgi:hypothetical protein
MKGSRFPARLGEQALAQGKRRLASLSETRCWAECDAQAEGSCGLLTDGDEIRRNCNGGGTEVAPFRTAQSKTVVGAVTF